MGALDGKVAVITGGNSGIGLATAKRFVEEGAYVFITGRQQAELDKAVSLIGKNVTAIQGDVTKPEDLDRIAAAAKAEKGIVDIIVSNAGFVEQASIDSLTPTHFDKTFNLNAKAPVFLVQKLLPLMTSGGSIILVGSAMHIMGVPGHTAYAATKAPSLTRRLNKRAGSAFPAKPREPLQARTLRPGDNGDFLPLTGF